MKWNTLLQPWPAVLWLEEAGSCNFTTNGYKYPTEETIGTQNFTSTSKFAQKGDFQPQILYFGRLFLEEDEVFDELKFLPARLTMPLSARSAQLRNSIIDKMTVQYMQKAIFRIL